MAKGLRVKGPSALADARVSGTAADTSGFVRPRGLKAWWLRLLVFSGSALGVTALIGRDRPDFAWFTWLVIVLGAGLIGVLACERAIAQAEGKTLPARRARARRQLAMTLLVYIAFGAGLWLLAVLTHSLWAVLAGMVAFLVVRVARGSWRL